MPQIANVFLNEQHTLLPSQQEALQNHPDFDGFRIVPVPAAGWTREQMDDQVKKYADFGSHTVMASPIPYLIGRFAGLCENNQMFVYVLHNDKRNAIEKTNPDGTKTVVHTVAKDGWECLRVA